MLRVECPECKTSYTGARLGLDKLEPAAMMSITVLCKTCGKSFDTFIEPKIVVVEPGWFSRYVMRREPTRTLDGHNAISIARE